jgi:hypothetical protein
VVTRDWWAVAWEGQVLELPGMAQAICVRKRFEPIEAGTPPKAEEWHYWATSLRPEEASLAELAGWIRGGWQIENGLHYPKDYTLGEDRHVLRKGGAPIALSLLRSMVLMLLGRIELAGLPAQSYPQKMAYLAGNVERALELINSCANSFM